MVLSLVLATAAAGSMLAGTPVAAFSDPAVLAEEAATADLLPARIPLPAGWRPEGIAIDGIHFFVGSLANGAILKGDLITGESQVLVPGTAGTMSVGLEIDELGRIWAAGGAGGGGSVYDSRTGAKLAQFQFATAPTFINDAVVTRDAVYFTDSVRPFLYVVPLGPAGSLPDPSAVRALALSGGAAEVSGFSNNGIEVTPFGRLLVLQSGSGRLFDVDPGTGASRQVDLGGASLVNGDGMIRRGLTLFVVQNRLNQVAVVRFDLAFTTGTVVRTITDPALDVPATAALFGPFLYLANARYTTPPTPQTAYDVVRVRA